MRLLLEVKTVIDDSLDVDDVLYRTEKDGELEDGATLLVLSFESINDIIEFVECNKVVGGNK